jgi:hypothetical protein
MMHRLAKYLVAPAAAAAAGGTAATASGNAAESAAVNSEAAEAGAAGCGNGTDSNAAEVSWHTRHPQQHLFVAAHKPSTCAPCYLSHMLSGSSLQCLPTLRRQTNATHSHAAPTIWLHGSCITTKAQQLHLKAMQLPLCPAGHF